MRTLRNAIYGACHNAHTYTLSSVVLYLQLVAGVLKTGIARGGPFQLLSLDHCREGGPISIRSNRAPRSLASSGALPAAGPLHPRRAKNVRREETFCAGVAILLEGLHSGRCSTYMYVAQGARLVDATDVLQVKLQVTSYKLQVTETVSLLQEGQLLRGPFQFVAASFFGAHFNSDEFQ